jgi:hypothetical protein
MSTPELDNASRSRKTNFQGRSGLLNEFESCCIPVLDFIHNFYSSPCRLTPLDPFPSLRELRPGQEVIYSSTSLYTVIAHATWNQLFSHLSIPLVSKFLCGGTTNSIITCGRVCGVRPTVSPAANPVNRFDLRRSKKGLQESVGKEGDGNVFGMVCAQLVVRNVKVGATDHGFFVKLGMDRR